MAHLIVDRMYLLRTLRRNSGQTTGRQVLATLRRIQPPRLRTGSRNAVWEQGQPEERGTKLVVLLQQSDIFTTMVHCEAAAMPSPEPGHQEPVPDLVRGQFQPNAQLMVYSTANIQYLCTMMP